MSSSFTYYAPTEVVFGQDTETKAGALVKKWGGTKVLLHYGGESARRSGLLTRIKASLEAEGIAVVELGGVVPNPRLSLVHTGIALARREGVDFLLAVGGGSVIDSAKAIGYGIYNEGEVWDFYEQKRRPQGCTPVGAVLTIAAAGSEMSSSSVITNEDGNLKRGLNTDYSRCKFAVMNPTLTYTLPPYQTMSGAVDIMMHTIERYFVAGSSMALTDEMAEALLRVVMASARTLKSKSDDYEARANLMWASSLSHNGLTGCGHASRAVGTQAAAIGPPTNSSMRWAGCSMSPTGRGWPPSGAAGRASSTKSEPTASPASGIGSWACRSPETTSSTQSGRSRASWTSSGRSTCPPPSPSWGFIRRRKRSVR